MAVSSVGFVVMSRGALNSMEPESNKYMHVRRLTIEECTDALKRLSQLIKYVQTGSGSEKLALVKQKDWIAVPIAIDGGFFQNAVEGFVKAAEYYERSEIIGIRIDLIDSDLSEITFPLPGYSVPATLEGAWELDPGTDLMIADCAAFAGNPDWVYVRKIEELQIIYGTEPITQMFTGISVDKAFENYQTWLEQSPMSKYWQTYSDRTGSEHLFKRIYNDLKSFNDGALPGTEVVIY
jgi:hypothetical protein